VQVKSEGGANGCTHLPSFSSLVLPLAMPTQVSRPPMNRSWHEAQSGRGVRDRMALLWARRHTGSVAATRGCMNMHRVLDGMLRRADTGGGGSSAAKVLSQKSTQITGPLTPATHRAPQLLRRRKHAAPPSLLVQPSAASAPTPALPPPLGIWCTKQSKSEDKRGSATPPKTYQLGNSRLT